MSEASKLSTSSSSSLAVSGAAAAGVGSGEETGAPEYDLHFQRPQDVIFISKAVERELTKPEARELLERTSSKQDELRNVIASAASIMQYAGMSRAVSDVLEFDGIRIRVTIDPEQDSASGQNTGQNLEDLLSGTGDSSKSAVSFDSMWA
eukprot:ANDGO_01602.mRNA.1 hypothetical protein